MRIVVQFSSKEIKVDPLFQELIQISERLRNRTISEIEVSKGAVIFTLTMAVPSDKDRNDRLEYWLNVTGQ